MLYVINMQEKYGLLEGKLSSKLFIIPMIEQKIFNNNTRQLRIDMHFLLIHVTNEHTGRRLEIFTTYYQRRV